MTIETSMTEEVARMHFCCGPDGCGAHQNASAQEYDAPRVCISSQCMAWRWVMPEPEFREGGMHPGIPTRGYCGLAGKP